MWPFTRTRANVMPQSWRTEQRRLEQRVEYHGVSLKQWPIRKLINEASPKMTAARLRKRA